VDFVIETGDASFRGTNAAMFDGKHEQLAGERLIAG